MSLYRRIFKQALGITWRNKYLWFFGLFAALLGNGGDYDIISRFLAADSAQGFSWRSLVESNLMSGKTFGAIAEFMTEDPFSFILTMFVGLFLLVLSGFLVWLSITSQAALVNDSAALSVGRKSSLKAGITAGGKHFWPVLGLNIINKVLVGVVFLLIGLPVAASFNLLSITASNFLYFLGFLIFVPVAVILSFIIKYAIAYKVIKNDDFVASLKRGWELFKDNWLVSVEMAFILFFINLFYGLAVLLAMLALAVPLLFLALIFYYMTSLVGFWLVATLSLVLFFVLIVIAGSYLAAFQIFSWTSLFIELTGRGATAKIVRVAKAWVK